MRLDTKPYYRTRRTSPSQPHLEERMPPGLRPITTCHQGQTSVIVLSDGEVADDVVVALLGVGEGEAGVDLQGLAGGVAAVGVSVALTKNPTDMPLTCG